MNLSSDEDISDEFSSRASSDLDDLDDLDDDDHIEWEDVSVNNNGDEKTDITFNTFHQSMNDSTISAPYTVLDNNKSRPITLETRDASILQIKPISAAKKKRRFNKISNVSSDIQTLLSNLHKSHLLLRTYHSIIISNSCSSDGLLLHISHSLVPSSFIINHYGSTKEEEEEEETNRMIPSTLLLDKFMKWFHTFTDIKAIRQKRARIRKSNEQYGAPTYHLSSSSLLRHSSSTTTTTTTTTTNKRGKGKQSAWTKSLSVGLNQHNTNKILTGWGELRTKLIDLLVYLSPSQEDNPEYVESFIDMTPYEKLWLFICMTRSIGWRVRYCSTMNIISLDLTPQHPLFALDNVKDIIRRLYANQNILTEISKSDDFSIRCSTPKKLSDETSLKKKSSSLQPKKDSIDVQQQGMMDYCGQTEYFWAEILCQRKSHDHKSTKDKSHGGWYNYRWTHVDPVEAIINEPMSIQNLVHKGEKSKSIPIAYAVGVEHEVLNHLCMEEEKYSTYDFQRGNITDVTPRYTKSWSQTLILRGSTKKQLKARMESEKTIWWNETIQQMNHLLHKKQQLHHDTKQEAKKDFIEKTKDNKERQELRGKLKDDKAYDTEQHEFKETIANEPIPTNKIAFKTHPLYVIPSALNANEALNPQSSQRVVGFFKGERVFLRRDVSLALPAKQWLYRGRKVKDSELSKPTKTAKARRKPVKRGFQALKTYGANRMDEKMSDEMVVENLNSNSTNDTVGLYGDWQTDSWSPPYVGPDDFIPVNEHKNVELALIPRGLIHLEQPRMAFIAKKLAIPYAPCLVGFEGFGGNRAPMIRGIVVHKSNVDILLEAYAEWESKEIEDQVHEFQKKIVGRWKRLVFAALTNERLKEKYEND